MAKVRCGALSYSGRKAGRSQLGQQERLQLSIYRLVHPVLRSIYVLRYFNSVSKASFTQDSDVYSTGNDFKIRYTVVCFSAQAASRILHNSLCIVFLVTKKDSVSVPIVVSLLSLSNDIVRQRIRAVHSSIIYPSLAQKHMRVLLISLSVRIISPET